MKTYKYLFLLIGLSIVGCSDLEEDPITELSPESYFSSLSLEQVEGFVAGSYAHMLHRNFMSREMTQALMFRSDMMAIGRTGAQERIDHDNFTVQADNALIAGGSNVYWPKVYQIIGAANEAIAAGNALTEEDEAVVNEVLARARFARAFAYFHLVRQFGDIPYLDETTILSEAAVAPRTPAADIYASIIEDLEFAKQWLPNTQASRAIPAKSAASAYLALVYLTMEDWQKSYDEAKDIINNEGTYNLALEPNFQNLFDAIKNDESLEPIFILDFTGVSDGDQGRDYQVAFTGIRSDDQYDMGGGWSVEVPALKVFTTWDDQDYRRAVTFDATAVQGGAVVPYTNFTDADGRAVNRPHVGKYTRMASKLPQQDGNGRTSHSNYMMMRYAEVLMIGAEAANELGIAADAEAWVNRVMARSRAGGLSWANGAEVTIPPSAVPADFSGLSQADFRTRILEERRLEFAYEMKRWYDITRRKLGNEVFGANGLESEVSTESGVGPGPKSFDPSRDYLLPIPASEIIINPNLTQNPGY
ncbi:RagB/SusD family nutrient uptake outer membrane protein [Zobellia laminariae]|uniref:RagB/SusD family nutrient uptake outer membrane protein n=1 Tax=Flavobacteriaceae TaxID=49546 RepID=UPI0012D94249|nr:RagB/SusD family nutrient uptake outer membrane protein [Zobellia laminariae]MUH38745.1 RagB/SusD family nutrient uptake outer membrane protein [Zobellia laminariae]WKX74728.1 RagB/SusD family nutrient uptake outer membrane protein [Zobellia laminariae]